VGGAAPVSGWWLASYVVLWVMVAATLVVLLVVLRQLGLLYLRVGGGAVRGEQGPPDGAILGAFEEVAGPDGGTVSFPDPAAALNLLVFATPHCRICKEALRGLPAATRGLDVFTLVVSEGTEEDNRPLRRLVDGAAAFTISAERQKVYGIETFPFAVVADGDGRVLDRGTVNGLDDLEEMLERASARAGPEERGDAGGQAGRQETAAAAATAGEGA
jgi:methylamine dehydrogenase accessory protein MauD